LVFSESVDNRQSAYLVILLSAAVKEIQWLHPPATVQDVLTILGGSHALFTYAQADEWLQAVLRDEGIDCTAISRRNSTEFGRSNRGPTYGVVTKSGIDHFNARRRRKSSAIST
jgi:hypothetical protein